MSTREHRGSEAGDHAPDSHEPPATTTPALQPMPAADGGAFTPEAAAAMLRRRPDQQHAIMTWLHQTAGSAFVRQVIGVLQAPTAARPAADPAVSGPIDPPVAGLNEPGFIDNSDGANLRNRPREQAGSHKLTDTPLPPATHVFVSGRHPSASDWWYVTAFLPGSIVRGYVQGLRVNTGLPEPTARLYQIKPGDTVEKLAAQEYKAAVRDGHDLRYYENVLLQVNAKQGRKGITGTYQDPGLLGGGSNHIQLEAGHRIWLVSPAYAHSLEGVVPDGSLTGGAYAKVQRFVGHVMDLVHSVTESPSQFGQVAGEYAQAIRDHMVEIVGIVAGFIMAEAASAFLAATPTGVGQIAAVVIQLALAAFGAAGLVTAGGDALKHAEQWLKLGWTAHGKADSITAASVEFLRMLVSIAMAALSYLGVKANLGKAATIASSMPTALPAFTVAGGGQVSAGHGTAVATGLPGPAGPLGTAMAMASRNDNTELRDSSEREAEPAAHTPGQMQPAPNPFRRFPKPGRRPPRRVFKAAESCVDDGRTLTAQSTNGTVATAP